MKMELERDELLDAVKLYIKSKGVDLDNQDVDIRVSKNGITTVTITDVKDQTGLPLNSQEKPFSS